MDKGKLNRFFQFFDYSKVTLASPNEKGGWVSKAFDDKHSVINYVARYTKVNHFFMVNEGDGVIHKDKGLATPRSQASVIFLTSLFLDNDGAPSEAVNSFLKQKGIIPHYVINTSPNKYHYYIGIEKIPASPLNIKKWKACQRALIYLGNVNRNPTGLDPCVTNYSCLLRVPNSYHLKDINKPFFIDFSYVGNHQKYDLDTLFAVLNGEAFLDSEAAVHTPYEIPNRQIKESERHHEMTRFLGSMFGRDVPQHVAEMALYWFIEKHFENARLFLPGGPRNKEITDFISYKLAQQREAREQEVSANVSRLLEQESPSSVLPETFFLGAPGIFGEIVREVDKVAQYRLPQVTWATFLAALGTLKRGKQTEDGIIATNYFICLAGSGTGKNHAQNEVGSLFDRLGISQLLDLKVRSDTGLLSFLKKSGGSGLITADEAEDFLKSLYDAKAPHYIKNCKSLLVQLYTMNKREKASFGHVASGSGKNGENIVVERPHLNLVLFGHPHLVERAFSLEAVRDGFMQRCLVINVGKKERIRNKEANGAWHLNGQYMDYCRSTATESNIILDGVELLKDKQTRQIVKYTPKARALLESYHDSLDKRYNEEDQLNEHLAPLFTRGTEQVKRLSLAATDGNEINEHTVDYFITFMDHQIKCIYETVSAQATEDTIGRKLEKFTLGFARICAKQGKASISYRDIVRNSGYKNSYELKELLNLAISTGHVKTVRGSRANQILYSLDDVLS